MYVWMCIKVHSVMAQLNLFHVSLLRQNQQKKLQMVELLRPLLQPCLQQSKIKRVGFTLSVVHTSIIYSTEYRQTTCITFHAAILLVWVPH